MTDAQFLRERLVAELLDLQKKGVPSSHTDVIRIKADIKAVDTQIERVRKWSLA